MNKLNQAYLNGIWIMLVLALVAAFLFYNAGILPRIELFEKENDQPIFGCIYFKINPFNCGKLVEEKQNKEIPTGYKRLYVFYEDSAHVIGNFIFAYVIVLTVYIVSVSFGFRSVSLQKGITGVILKELFLAAILLVCITGIFFLIVSDIGKKIDNIENHYKKKTYDVVEGKVKVLYRQPKSGHSGGDKIVIQDKKFEIDYFITTTILI
jgi:hypothetical protein